MSSTLYCFATRAHLCIYFLLLATGITFLSFWQVQVPYTKSHFRRFREFHAYPFAQVPGRLQAILRFQLFLCASLFLLVYILFYFCPKNSANLIFSWFPPINPFIFSQLRYPT